MSAYREVAEGARGTARDEPGVRARGAHTHFPFKAEGDGGREEEVKKGKEEREGGRRRGGGEEERRRARKRSEGES